MIEHLWSLLRDFGGFITFNFDPFPDFLDIAMVAVGIYWMLALIRGTRAVQILVGLMILIGVYLAAQILELSTVSWVFERFLPSAVLIVIVLFQQDIRRALARVGRRFFSPVSEYQESQILEEVVRAAQALAQRHIGALIVFERESELDEEVQAGVVVDAHVTQELLTSIFVPYSPLHDGAVLIQNGRLSSAGCVLPLTTRQDLPDGVGTRHRAAVGITEETDAVVVVVSEETTRMSIAVAGELRDGLDAPELRESLREILAGKPDDEDDDEEESTETKQDTPASTDPARSAS